MYIHQQEGGKNAHSREEQSLFNKSKFEYALEMLLPEQSGAGARAGMKLIPEHMYIYLVSKEKKCRF